MFNSTLTESSIRDNEADASKVLSSPNALVKDFLYQNSPAFVRLDELRERGWANPQGDDYFKKQRRMADTASSQIAWRFFHMMVKIGDELQASTGALRQTSSSAEAAKILDLCMAPGGYTASALKYNPGATAYGVTLPPSQGGHKRLFRQSTVMLLDITMLAGEFGVEEPPSTHPEYTSFLQDRPYLEHTFDLVFCDGQVLRQHQRHEYREKHETLRLLVSQLILAMQRIRQGGTLIMLLHKIDAWYTVELLYYFSHFSSIQVFKPKKAHAKHSSFYLIAKDVQPDSEAAQAAIGRWKMAWSRATFGGEAGTDDRVMVDCDHVKRVLDQFGSKLVELGRPLWDIQAEALSKMDFTK